MLICLGVFWLLQKSCSKEAGWVGTEWLGLNEEKNSKWSKGGGDGGVSYLPHLVIPTQKENCVGKLLEWWLFIWKEAA